MKRIFSIIFIVIFLPVWSRANSLDNIAKTICKGAGKIKNKRIAVLPFPYHDGTEAEDSSIISEKLTTKIVQRKKMQVVERSLLEKVLSELKLQQTGAIDQESAKQLGNVLGVEAIVTGTLIDMGNNQIEINARLIHAESGLVFSAAHGIETRTWKEENRAPSSKNMENSDEETKKKMSVFFHSRDWTDPRFRQDADASIRVQDDFSNRVQETSVTNSMVLTNVRDRSIATRIGEEAMIDSPNYFFPESDFQDPAYNKVGMDELMQAWQTLNKGEINESLVKFSEIKSRFDSNSDPRYIRLVELYLAECYFRQGKFHDCMEQARYAAQRLDFPKLKANALYLIARSFEKVGKFNVSLGLYREILQNYPFESRLVHFAGRRLQGQFKR